MIYDLMTVCNIIQIYDMYVCLYTHKLHLLSHLYNSPICRVILFFFPPRKVNGFTDPDGWRYARHFGKGALWRFGTFGEERVGYGRGNKKTHGLKGSLITFIFFSQKQIIFSSSSTAAFFPTLSYPA